MKKWKKILALVLCLMFIQAPIVNIIQPVTVEAAAVKKGLKKEGGKYYFYDKGKRVKNTWKTVKVKKNGKIVSYRYYFGKNGAAYAGRLVYGLRTPAVKKINGKYYGFGISGRMIKGTYVINDKFFVFNSKTGVGDAARSKQLRKASAYQKDASALRKMLGKPKKTQVMDSCYGDGKDVLLTYPTFCVSLFRNTSGKEIVLGISSL